MSMDHLNPTKVMDFSEWLKSYQKTYKKLMAKYEAQAEDGDDEAEYMVMYTDGRLMAIDDIVSELSSRFPEVVK